MAVNGPIMAMIGSRPPTIMDGCLDPIFEAPLTARKTTVIDSQKNCIFHGHDLHPTIISTPPSHSAKISTHPHTLERPPRPFRRPELHPPHHHPYSSTIAHPSIKT